MAELTKTSSPTQQRILLTILAASILLLGGVVYMKFFAKSGNNQLVSTMPSTSKVGWIVELYKNTYDQDGSPVDSAAVAYVAVDRTGKFIKNLTVADAAKFDPINAYRLSYESDEKGNTTEYRASPDKKFIIKTLTIPAGLNKAKEMTYKQTFEIAENNGQTPEFKKIDFTANTYIAHTPTGGILYSIDSEDPNCAGVCGSFHQLYVKEAGKAAQKLGKPYKYGIVTDTYLFTGGKIVFTTYLEGGTQLFVADLTKGTVQELTSVLHPKIPDFIESYYPDFQTDSIFYKSAMTPSTLTVSRYNLTTGNSEKVFTAENTKSSWSLVALYAKSPSGRVLYTHFPDTSSDIVNLVPYDLELKKLLPSIVRQDYNISFTYNKEKLSAVSSFQDGYDLSITDFSDETNPQVTEVKLSALPDIAHDGVELIGPWSGE